MKKIVLIFIIFLYILLSAQLLAQDYKIVVHKSNPVSSMTKKKISKLFLKEVSKWKNKTKVLPVDLKANSSVREKFSKEIHSRSVKAIQTHWQMEIFSGRDVPPPEYANDKEVLTFVKENPGAIGYVSKLANTAEVKVLIVKSK